MVYHLLPVLLHASSPLRGIPRVRFLPPALTSPRWHLASLRGGLFLWKDVDGYVAERGGAADAVAEVLETFETPYDWLVWDDGEIAENADGEVLESARRVRSFPLDVIRWEPHLFEKVASCEGVVVEVTAPIPAVHDGVYVAGLLFRWDGFGVVDV